MASSSNSGLSMTDVVLVIIVKRPLALEDPI